MTRNTAVGRRGFLATATACGAFAGCLGTQQEQPGIIDYSDVTVKSPKNADLTTKAVKNEDNRGLEITTNNSVIDGKIVAMMPTSVPNVERSSIYIGADIKEIDDDAEVEIRFQSPESGHRSVYIGNEFKKKKSGVLATEPGTGFSLESSFSELPGTTKAKKDQPLKRIEFLLSEGDFHGTIWDLYFTFEDKTVLIL